MLDLVRKHARSWLIKVALFLIVIVFIFWGGYSYTTREESQMAWPGSITSRSMSITSTTSSCWRCIGASWEIPSRKTCCAT